MSQWFFKITDYAEELLRDIDDKLEGWPERVKTMQREWIGKSEGAFIDFKIEGRDEKIRVFTTRPDTIFGVTFLSLAYEHPLVKEFAKTFGTLKDVEELVEKARRIDHEARLAGNYDKEGVFTGAHCIHPFTGARIPVYCANFVVMDYGTGAVMAVPAHDQRDFEFAKKYGIPVKVVIQREGDEIDATTMTEAWEGPGTLVNSGDFAGMKNDAAIKAVAARLATQGAGGPTVAYRLKDWCLSRQRYWGAPIPIIYCEKCGAVAVPEKDLPIVLPRDVELTGEGGSPLARLESFVSCKCPDCGGKARRETDTMDTFVESSWYMLRYACPKYKKGPVDPAMMDYWLPVDQYIGGIEHAVGHLIYCRYFTKVMRDLGLLKLDEPVKNLMTQGMVYKDGAKMSKSKGNVVDPDEMIEKYGADTVRLFSLFASPPEKDLEWSELGVEGAHRFILRVWRLVSGWEDGGAAPSDGGERMMHKTIKKVTEDIERYHFNTAIAAIMEYVNFLYGMEAAQIPKTAIETLVLLMSPFAPHVAEELWRNMGRRDSILKETWPVFDESKIAQVTMTIVVQVNGKLRGKMEVHADIGEEELKSGAFALSKVSAELAGRSPRKVVVVPKKLVNIVV